MSSGDKVADQPAKPKRSCINKKEPKLTPEEVIGGFNALRSEQRQIANKIYELESDLSEHKIVLETLEETPKDRKCFQMIGGVLVESTVENVLPALKTNSDQLKTAVENLNTKLLEKGKEILEYKDKYQIQFHRQGQLPQGGGIPPKIPEEDEEQQSSKSSALKT